MMWHTETFCVVYDYATDARELYHMTNGKLNHLKNSNENVNIYSLLYLFSIIQ